MQLVWGFRGEAKDFAWIGAKTHKTFFYILHVCHSDVEVPAGLSIDSGTLRELDNM